jgi:hypothetical protein
MGVHSKLTESQWAKALEWSTVDGMTNAQVGRKIKEEFGVTVSAATLSAKITKRSEKIKDVGNQLVGAKLSLKALGITEQTLANSYADLQLQMRDNMNRAAANMARVVDGYAQAASQAIDEVDFTQPHDSEDNQKRHTFISGASKAVKDASHLPLELMKITEPPKPPSKPVPKGLSSIYPSAEILGEEEAEEGENDD